MQTHNNLSHSFHLSGSNKTMLVGLKPNSEMEAKIDNAEQFIRSTLGQQLPSLLRDQLPLGSAVPKPKFLRQGSRAYDTLNDPIRSSKNYCEADSDVGLYLPLEFIKETAETPKLGAHAIRAAVLICRKTNQVALLLEVRTH